MYHHLHDSKAMLTQTLQPLCDLAATDFVATDSRPIAVDVRPVSDLMKYRRFYVFIYNIAYSIAHAAGSLGTRCVIFNMEVPHQKQLLHL